MKHEVKVNIERAIANGVPIHDIREHLDWLENVVLAKKAGDAMKCPICETPDAVVHCPRCKYFGCEHCDFVIHTETDVVCPTCRERFAVEERRESMLS